jgi:hypothetical protein
VPIQRRQLVPLLQPMYDACYTQLQYWHDFIQLRKIDKLPSVSSSVSVSASTMERMIEKLYHSHKSNIISITKSSSITTTTTTATTTANRTLSMNRQFNGEQQQLKYVTKTTWSLSDIMLRDINSKSFMKDHVDAVNDTNTRIANIFRDYGIVIISNYCTTKQIHDCYEQAQTALLQLQNESCIVSRNLQINSTNDAFDFMEVRQRPGHRVDNRYTILDDKHSPIVQLGQHILRDIIMKRLFPCNNNSKNGKHDNSNSNWKLLYAGVVHAFPRDETSTDPNFPPPQFWHRDGPSLFDESIGNNHHPTHCFNVFIALIDVYEGNGTTEFVPGTHEDKRYNTVVADILLNQREKYQNDAGIVRADVKAGTLIFFDIRVLHRGLSNQSNTERPVLYYTFGRDWFQEQHMFQKVESIIQNKNDIIQSSSIAQICKELYTTIVGKHDDTSNSVSILNPSDVNALDYGHPHYTTRFDLLLIEQWMTPPPSRTIPNTTNVDSMNNYTAVLKFHNLTKEQFVENLYMYYILHKHWK